VDEVRARSGAAEIGRGAGQSVHASCADTSVPLAHVSMSVR